MTNHTSTKAKQKQKLNTALEIGGAALVGTATAAAGFFALPAVASLAIGGVSAGLTQSFPKLIEYFNNRKPDAELTDEAKDELIRACINSVLEKNGLTYNYFYTGCKAMIQDYTLNVAEILKDNIRIQSIPEDLYDTWYAKGDFYVSLTADDRLLFLEMLRSYIASLVMIEFGKGEILIQIMDKISENTDKLQNYEIELLELKRKVEQLSPEIAVTHEKLWEASRQQFMNARKEGGRFYQTRSIIQDILPQGLISNEHFQVIGKNEEDQAAPVRELFAKEEGHLTIVGEGGIGKTTFLQQILMEQFYTETGTEKSYSDQKQVFFFVELNRCPDHVDAWYDDTLRKTNFITRYIGQTLENHQSMDTVSRTVLDQIEKEFQKTPEQEKRQYVLLLDGFNEVRTTNSVREYLSQEIMHLQKYANVRIITTSRETQAAFFTNAFRNIQLIGLKENQIQTYLEKCQVKQPVIGTVMNSPVLLQCLRIPLYICMFTSVQLNSSAIPETAGEILYAFFYGNASFYNARNRIKEIETAAFSNEKMAFVLDFVLPYIGWYYEENELFSADIIQMKQILEKAFSSITATVLASEWNDFGEFQNCKKTAGKILEEFFDQQQDLKTEEILDFLTDYLGIMYRYNRTTHGGGKIRYAFCHHHFRDFYSAMWDIQLLRSLGYLNADQFKVADCENADSFDHVLNSKYWSVDKVHFISQILKEHRNRSVFDINQGNWKLSQESSWEQKVLGCAIDFCRLLFKNHIDTKHILRNILSAILDGRGDLAGLDLNDLNLEHCNFFNITCSKPGNTYNLTTDFKGSLFGENCFQPENHRDPVIEYVYHDSKCFTIDRDGFIKCWDLKSGILENEWNAGIPENNSELSVNGFMRISSDGRWLAVKVQELHGNGYDLHVAVFDLMHPEEAAIRFRPDSGHKVLNYFSFTEDAKGILMLLDKKHVYCFDIENGSLCYKKEFQLFRKSEIYAKSVTSEIMAFSAEYSQFIEPYYLENDDEYEDDLEIEDDSIEDEEDDWDEEDDYEAEEYSEMGLDSDDDEDGYEADEFDQTVPCEILRLNPVDGSTNILYKFEGQPGVSPCATYNQKDGSFLLYNYASKHLELFRCRQMRVFTVLTELTDLDDQTPGKIYVHPEKWDECFIMYADCVFQAKYISRYGGSILTKYSIHGVEKLIPNSDDDGELRFELYAMPMYDRFIVKNDTNTYEWDTVKETITLKYNTAFYNVVSLLPINNKQGCIMVHQNNGISLFQGAPLRLKWQYCINDPGYIIGQVCQSEGDGLLAIAFARPDHEKVELFDVNSGWRKAVYSTIHKGETVVTLAFSSDRKYLLITTQYHSFEYSLEKDTFFTVRKAGMNERLIGGEYRSDLIEVVAVQHLLQELPQVDSRGILYERKDTGNDVEYILQGYYILPELAVEQRPFFIFENNDFGVLGPLDERNVQDYWITRGFFLESLPELQSVLNPVYYNCTSGEPVLDTMKIEPLEMVSVRHKFVLRDSFVGAVFSPSYMYLSEDMTEGVFCQENASLAYSNDLRTLDYEGLEGIFKKRIGNEKNGSYWYFAVPDVKGNLVGAFEYYMLMGISTETGKVKDEISYTPGVCVCDCDFTGARMSEEMMEMLKANGGMHYE